MRPAGDLREQIRQALARLVLGEGVMAVSVVELAATVSRPVPTVRDALNNLRRAGGVAVFGAAPAAPGECGRPVTLYTLPELLPPPMSAGCSFGEVESVCRAWRGADGYPRL